MPLSHTVKAFNTAIASENKIHDDTIARRFGFTGGLVPGVEVFAYGTHIPLSHFGRAWLNGGRMEMRFIKPVYDGHTATVSGTVNGNSLGLAIESNGVTCADGMATVDAPIVSEAPAWREPPAREHRPHADETSLAPGTMLSTTPKLIDVATLASYVADVGETAALYGDVGIIHPGQILRACNAALVENVVLPPWIHVGSRAHFLSEGRVGETIEARARVSANYDRQGHRLVDLDIVVLADRQRAIAQVLHTAIYRLRA